MSAVGRLEHRAAAADAAATLTLLNKLFGIGFGYHYGGVYFAVLMNTGWIGLIVYCYAFLKPAFLLQSNGGGLPLKVIMATLFLLFYISVSELFLPTTWMFLGIAYWYLDRTRVKLRWRPQLARSRAGATPIMAVSANCELDRHYYPEKSSQAACRPSDVR